MGTPIPWMLHLCGHWAVIVANWKFGDCIQCVAYLALSWLLIAWVDKLSGKISQQFVSEPAKKL